MNEHDPGGLYARPVYQPTPQVKPRSPDFPGNDRGNLAEAAAIRPGEATKRAAAWLEKFNLGEWANHKVEDLSKGMQQKMQLIGTILHRPPLLILDEPFSGLDPINTRELKNLMLQMAKEGVTIVLSTHVLPQGD